MKNETKTKMELFEEEFSDPKKLESKLRIVFIKNNTILAFFSGITTFTLHF